MADVSSFQFDDDNWQRILGNLRRKLDESKDVHRDFVALISTVVYGDIMDHFDQEEGSKGRWKAWSKAYDKHMRMIGKGGNKILQDTGRLRNSFTPSKWKRKPDGVLFYNNAKTKGGFPYAHAHNEGGPQLPKRDFMWLSKKGMDRMTSIVEKWLLEAAK